jgi:hypothetical protein
VGTVETLKHQHLLDIVMPHALLKLPLMKLPPLPLLLPPPLPLLPPLKPPLPLKLPPPLLLPLKLLLPLNSPLDWVFQRKWML